MFDVHVCICTTCMPDAQRDQKRAPEPLQLGLQMVVSHYVSAETKPRSSAITTNAFILGSIFPGS